MDKIAVFSGKENLYWHGIVMAAAIAVAFAMFWFLRTLQKGKYTGAVWITALAIPFGMVAGRAGYWLYRQEMYDGIGDAFAEMNGGGYFLYAAMIGVVIAAVVVNFAARMKSLREILDAMAPAGAMGICIGRLAAYFSASDKGKVVENEKFHKLPFAVQDASNGYWSLAVFIFESLFAFLVCLFLVGVFIVVYLKEDSKFRKGDVALLFLLTYGSGQCILESLRVDSLYFITLGFVRVSQVLSAVLVGFALVIFSIRMIKKFKFRLYMPIIWVALIGLLAVAFYMELRMTSEVYVRNYSTMASCLAVVCGSGIWMCFKTIIPGDKNESKSEEKLQESNV